MRFILKNMKKTIDKSGIVPYNIGNETGTCLKSNKSNKTENPKLQEAIYYDEVCLHRLWLYR